MAYDVFISYSSKDKPIADAMCATLENNGVRCWIAPRDIRAGMSWTAAIMQAISASKVMVLVWSTNANKSAEVTREVQHAFSKKVTVIPFRVEDITPSQDLEYYLKFVHWLDALTPPLERHLQELVKQVNSNLPPDSRALRSKEDRPQYAEAGRETKTDEHPARSKEEEAGRRQAELARQLAEKRERRKRWAESEATLSLAAAEERERVERELRVPRNRKDVSTEALPATQFTSSPQPKLKATLYSRQYRLQWIVGILIVCLIPVIVVVAIKEFSPKTGNDSTAQPALTNQNIANQNINSAVNQTSPMPGDGANDVSKSIESSNVTADKSENKTTNISNANSLRRAPAARRQPTPKKPFKPSGNSNGLKKIFKNPF